MADSKITALTSIGTITDPAVDPLVIVDVSDTSMAATGTTKKVTLNNLLACSPTATLASATITGDLTVRTNQLVVNSSGSFVGKSAGAVGTDGVQLLASGFSGFSASGTTALFVNRNTSDGTVLQLGRSGASAADFGAIAGGGFTVGLSGSEWMRINATGLGVGVASPDFKFAVNGTQAVPDTTGSSTTNGSLRIGAPGTGLVIDTGVTAAGAVYGWIQARARTDYSSNFNLVLQPNGGNVGIGVTPSAWAAGFKVLQVGSGPSISTNGNASRCDISTNYYYNAGNKFLTASGYATGISQENGNFYFQRSTTTSGGIGSSLTFDVPMTLDASGNLIIGTTGTNWSTVAGFYYFAGSSLNITRDGNPSLLLNRLTSDGAIADFRRSGSAVGSISVTTTSTAYNTSSDYRLKESVAPLTGGLARISALKPSIYKWKADGSNGEGFIAHELAEVVPAAVSGEKDAVNEDGSIKAQGVDLSKVVPVLVAAIQELAAEVNALKNA